MCYHVNKVIGAPGQIRSSVCNNAFFRRSYLFPSSNLVPGMFSSVAITDFLISCDQRSLDNSNLTGSTRDEVNDYVHKVQL